MSNQKLSILALIFSIFLLAYSSNPPNGVTGAPGEGTCTNCHNGATGGLAGSVSITGLLMLELSVVPVLEDHFQVHQRSIGNIPLQKHLEEVDLCPGMSHGKPQLPQVETQ